MPGSFTMYIVLRSMHVAYISGSFLLLSNFCLFMEGLVLGSTLSFLEVEVSSVELVFFVVFFLLRKIHPVLTSVPVFLYFVCESLPQPGW